MRAGPVVVMVLTLACSAGSALEPHPAADAAVAQVPVISKLASAFCARERDQEAAWRERCVSGGAVDWRAFLETFTPCPVLDELVARGTARFHAELADACLEANRADRDCSIAESPCANHVVEGMLATGAPCHDDYECPADAGCWAGEQFAYNACAANTCVHLPGVGEPCLQDPIPYCLKGLSCVKGVCMPQAREGEPCGVGRPLCAWRLACDGATCVQRGFLGGCRRDADCQPTHFCLNGGCALRGAVGGTCFRGELGLAIGCGAFATCGGDSVCLPAGRLGQPCSDHPDAPYACAEGICHRGVCQEKLANGRDCVRGSECASNGCAGGLCDDCGP
jgi:hypothetical protein